ncbi:MAG: NTP transferase domain-containing protein [Actinomycetota bacterium]|nr:NTP transferase domain-containing protein [Actinomycetota bacterium]
MTLSVTALVVAGGGSTRFGADKLDQPLGGTTVLGQLLASLPPDWPVVVVGPAREVGRPVTWALEDQPDGGPLAAIDAGLALVSTDLVVVLGGDMPFAGPAARRLADSLTQALSDPDDDFGVVAATARGGRRRGHPLLTAYVTASAREAMPETPYAGRAGALLEALPHLVLKVAADDLLDVDTPAQLEDARRRLGA